MAIKYKTITKTFDRSSDYRVGPNDVADFNIDTIAFPSDAIDITYFTATFNGALRSPTATSRTVSVQLEGYSNNLWRSFYSTSIVVKSLNEDNQIIISGTLDENAREAFLSYGIDDFRVKNISGGNHFEACESTNSIVFTYSYDVPEPSLLPPGDPVIAQNGDYFDISWTPATLVNASGTIWYRLIEGHEYEPIAEETTNTHIRIPLFYPAEVAHEGEGAWFLIEAAYKLSSGNEITATSGKVVWDPQHVLYYYTGILPNPWQQCEIYYYDGTEFRPCKINYYNQGWLG